MWGLSPGRRPRRPRHPQSRCVKTGQADVGNGDPDRPEEKPASINGRPVITQGRPVSTARRSSDQFRSDGDSRLRAGLSLRRRNWTRVAAHSSIRSTAWQGRPKTAGPPGRLPVNAVLPRRPRSINRLEAGQKRPRVSPPISAISVLLPSSRGLPISAAGTTALRQRRDQRERQSCPCSRFR